MYLFSKILYALLWTTFGKNKCLPSKKLRYYGHFDIKKNNNIQHGGWLEGLTGKKSKCTCAML